jgi:hypothetical protein
MMKRGDAEGNDLGPTLFRRKLKKTKQTAGQSSSGRLIQSIGMGIRGLKETVNHPNMEEYRVIDNNV